MDNANLWTRRANSAKLSLSMTGSDSKDAGAKVELPRTSKRLGPDSSHGRSNPFNAISPLSGSGVSSPSTNASSAFGLGSGAFASFGAPKTPGADTGPSKAPGDKRELSSAEQAPAGSTESLKTGGLASFPGAGAKEHPLKSTWVIWYRPPTPKYSDYEKSTIPLASISSVESFWSVYAHLKRPSLLPTVSDYHIFKKSIRPVWEDDANKKGGKWIVRLKKGVADRYWEDLLLAIIGDQFAEAADEVCGAVLSVRSGEDVLSVWTRIDGGRNIKIRETIKRLLAFPSDTNIIWKSHDDSIAQRSAINHARHEKAIHHNNQHHQSLGADRRRPTSNHDDTTGDKGKGTAS